MLTTAEMVTVGQVYAGVVASGAEIVGELREVLMDAEWVMGDAERMSRVVEL